MTSRRLWLSFPSYLIYLQCVLTTLSQRSETRIIYGVFLSFINQQFSCDRAASDPRQHFAPAGRGSGWACLSRPARDDPALRGLCQQEVGALQQASPTARA